MNLLECYIVEVFEETPIKTPDFDHTSQPWVKVKYKYNCYGVHTVTVDYFPLDRWNKIKERGYYMG